MRDKLIVMGVAIAMGLIGFSVVFFFKSVPTPPKVTPCMEWKQQFDLLRCPDQTGVNVSGIEIDMAALKLRCSYQPIKGK